jgi:hypothetical protein
MGNYGTCSSCKYCDRSETNGYKCYCEWYRTYEDPDVVRDCEHYRND